MSFSNPVTDLRYCAIVCSSPASGFDSLPQRLFAVSLLQEFDHRAHADTAGRRVTQFLQTLCVTTERVAQCLPRSMIAADANRAHLAARLATAGRFRTSIAAAP